MITMSKKGVSKKPYLGLVEGGDKPVASAPKRRPSGLSSAEKGNKPIGGPPKRKK